MTTQEKAELISELGQFTGTEHYYRHPFGIVYTDGIKYLAEKAGAYWLIDLVASWQCETVVSKEPFQVFTLKVNQDRTARVDITDGNKKLLEVQEIPFTDFPLEEISLWIIDRVLILPSEY